MRIISSNSSRSFEMQLPWSSVCIVDAMGKVEREVKVASEPEELIRYFNELDLPLSRIGLEAGPLSQWLHAGLVASGRDAVLLETRHVKAALSAISSQRKFHPSPGHFSVEINIRC
jgi:transposase